MLPVWRCASRGQSPMLPCRQHPENLPWGAQASGLWQRTSRSGALHEEQSPKRLTRGSPNRATNAASSADLPGSKPSTSRSGPGFTGPGRSYCAAGLALLASTARRSFFWRRLARFLALSLPLLCPISGHQTPPDAEIQADSPPTAVRRLSQRRTTAARMEETSASGAVRDQRR